MGEAITFLTLTEPTAGQMLRWAGLTGMAANIAAVAAVSGRPVSVIEQMAARDMIKAATFIDAFGLVEATIDHENVSAIFDLPLAADRPPPPTQCFTFRGNWCCRLTPEQTPELKEFAMHDTFSTAFRARSSRCTWSLSIAGISALVLAASGVTDAAQAQALQHQTTVTGQRGTVAASTTVRRNGSVTRHVVAIDRSRPGWWRGQPGFGNYRGVRGGHYFAPGYGYYRIPAVGVRTTWHVGGILTPSMRRYVVVNPALYGLAVAPAGHGWYFAGPNMVLVIRSSGVIVRSVAGGW